MNQLLSKSVVATACLILMAGTAVGQERGPGPGRRQDPALKGPPVREGGVPGEHRRFGEGEGGPKERMQREIPHRAFARAFEVLRSDRVSDDMHLTADQDEELRSLSEGMRHEMDRYRAEHRREVEQLAKQLPPEDRRRIEMFMNGPREERAQEDRQPGPERRPRGDGQGQRPRPDGDRQRPGQDPDRPRPEGRKEGADPQAQEARARMREIVEEDARAADVHAKMFAVLDADQRQAVEKELQRVRSELDRRRESGSGGPGGPEGKGGKGQAGDRPRLSDEQRERIKNMSPEEKEKYLQEVRGRRGQGGEGKGRRPEPKRPEPVEDDR